MRRVLATFVERPWLVALVMLAVSACNNGSGGGTGY